MTARLVLGRLASAVAALFLLVGLVAPAAVASTVPAAAPAAAPALPPVDWWGLGRCATWLLPNAPKMPGGPVECAKAAVKGGQAVHELNKKALSAAAQKVKDSILGDAAQSAAEFVGEFMRVTLGWWLMTDSVQVKDSGVLGDAKDPTKSLSLHALMAGIGAGIATILTIFQGIKMIMQRKGTPLGQILQGLFLNLLVSAAGVGVIDALLIASDQLTEAILYVGFGGDDVPDRMAVMLIPAIANPIGLLGISFTVFMIGGIQIVMLFLRQAAIPIQALLLPVAGAGQLGGDSARQWLPRLFTMIMTVIVYKPMAALIISVGFTEMANGSGIIDFVRGVVTLALSVIALKSLLALFSPLGLAIGGAVAGGGALGALSPIAGAMAGQMGGAGGDSAAGGSGGGTSATQHASDMDRNGPAAGDSGGSSEGSAAIDQANSSSIPQQAGESTAATAETGAVAEGTTTAQAAGTQMATQTATTAAPPLAIAMVAAEAGQQGIKKAGGAVGGTE